jgi:hypothetical protein
MPNAATTPGQASKTEVGAYSNPSAASPFNPSSAACSVANRAGAHGPHFGHSFGGLESQGMRTTGLIGGDSLTAGGIGRLSTVTWPCFGQVNVMAESTGRASASSISAYA